MKITSIRRCSINFRKGENQMNTEVGKKYIVLLNPELQNKFHSQVRYVLLECSLCGKTWGCSPAELSMIDERMLVCRNCAGDVVYSNLKQDK
jgi:hypothetical protein